MPSASGAKKVKGMNKKNLQHFEKRLLEERRRVLKELGHYDETFGKCHNCGQDIAFERLDALPHARYCIECKQREEDAKK
jgi:RNA polymerase-binding transcription factor DksA